MAQANTPGSDLSDLLAPSTNGRTPVTQQHAAELVENYVTDTALSALDRVLSAADNQEANILDVARETTDTANLLDQEVKRFRTLNDQNGGSNSF